MKFNFKKIAPFVLFICCALYAQLANADTCATVKDEVSCLYTALKSAKFASPELRMAVLADERAWNKLRREPVLESCVSDCDPDPNGEHFKRLRALAARLSDHNRVIRDLYSVWLDGSWNVSDITWLSGFRGFSSITGPFISGELVYMDSGQACQGDFMEGGKVKLCSDLALNPTELANDVLLKKYFVALMLPDDWPLFSGTRNGIDKFTLLPRANGNLSAIFVQCSDFKSQDGCAVVSQDLIPASKKAYIHAKQLGTDGEDSRLIFAGPRRPR